MLSVKLKRVDRIYHPKETVRGVVVVNAASALSHQGITLKLQGAVQLQLSARSVGLFEAFYNSIKPVQLLHYTIDVARAGKLPAGRSELPFEFALEPLPGQTLYETYHGVFVNVQYSVTCELRRGMLAKDVTTQLEFIVHQQPAVPRGLKENPRVPFSITPQSLENVKKTNLKGIPKFVVAGELDRAVSDIRQPFTGWLVVEECASPIVSIDVQLARVETCGCADGYAKEATEIQNIQIADGDVERNVRVPIFMVFPRLFTCPSLATRTFKIDFEVNIVIAFPERRVVTWNLPIRIVRAPLNDKHRLFL